MRTLIERIAAGESTAEDAALVQAVLDAAQNMTVTASGKVDFDQVLALCTALDRVEEAVTL